MKFKIEKEVFEKFPGLNIGIVIARNIDNKGQDKGISHLLSEIENLIETDFTPAKISKHKLISPWKRVFLAFGAKPEIHHTSLEKLMRIVMEEGSLKRENKLVDTYRYLSLKHLVPIAADDLQQVMGDISLTLAKGDEFFVSALGEKGSESPKKEEVIYKDDIQVLNRRWNSEECYKTMIVENTRDAILYVEGLYPVTEEEVASITEELAGLVEGFLKGDSKFVVLNENKNVISF